MPLLSVVVPTYNEADHVEELLRQIVDACIGLDYEVIVVDDDSPDGTAGRVQAAAAADPRIQLVLRKNERGLATAVIEGIRRSTGHYVVAMDSDFQHPPATIPRLVEAAQRTGSDLVVASRYAEGGQVHGFPMIRRVISWGAKTLAVLGLPRVRKFRITDPMSGFFLARREAVDPDRLRPLGYKILIEILARARIERATEVGFVFTARRAGESKLRLRTQYDYFRHVVRLGLADPENRRILLFMFVGLTGIVVNLGIYLALQQLFDVRDPVLLLIPASIARETSILWNFWWNDTITFQDLRQHAHANFLQRVVRFNVVSLLAWAAYLGIFEALVLLRVHHVAALLVAIAITFVFNYRGNRRWTYARRAEPANG